MAGLQRCIELLERNQVRYTHTRRANAYRAREVATAEHVPAGRLAKTIIFCRGDLYALAVIPPIASWT
jgi:prolyl-tRNA editing enzyme YbaK/EbsC (Cys-tRNA(Pro) deacylase)